MGRKEVDWHTGFVGERYHAVQLCEMFCLIDIFPDDPEYRRKAAGGCVLYFQKILEELPSCRENAMTLTERARLLEKEWKEGPDYTRKIEEQKKLTSVRSTSINKYRSYTRPVNCHPFEKPPEMRNFPKGHKRKKKNPAE